MTARWVLSERDARGLGLRSATLEAELVDEVDVLLDLAAECLREIDQQPPSRWRARSTHSDTGAQGAARRVVATALAVCLATVHDGDDEVALEVLSRI